MNTNYRTTQISSKGFIPMLLLCFFTGFLGFHRFYAGKPLTGLLMLFTAGGFGIWTIIDFVMIALGNFTDGNALPIKN